jgi:hypothetical protein
MYFDYSVANMLLHLYGKDTIFCKGSYLSEIGEAGQTQVAGHIRNSDYI